MRKLYLTLLPMLFLSLAVGLQSCTKDDEPTELIADDNTFANFTDWSLDVEKVGIDPSLGAAHGGNDSTTVRKIYFKDGVKRSGDEYPIGALILKHSYNSNGQVNMRTGMVKRGNNFDTEHNNWEYFVLAPDGKIAQDADGNKMRGSNLMNGMCVGCHNGASSKDYIFTK
jgi:hypothetical protein